jgi:thiol-disulfide isomerase/thioredoxin
MKIRTSLLGLALICGAPASLGATAALPQPADAINLDEELKDYKLPDLWLGKKAPELQVRRTVKGETFTGFKPDRVYVVECWATWCGPCIVAFPHLSELAKTHADKVTVLGVNIWDERTDDADLDEFVKQQGDRMAYTVVRQAMVETDDGEQGSVEANWMAPAGQNGIPAAFIVDGKGMIAWIGHPMSMDEPLQAIVDGSYDLAAESKKAAAAHRAEAWGDRMFELMGAGDSDRIRKIAHALMAGEFKDSPEGLSMLMGVMGNMPGATDEDRAFAIRAGTKACEIDKWENWLPIAQLGLAHGGMENYDEGIRLLKMSKDKCPDEGIRGQIDNIIAEMEADKAEAAGGEG